MSGASPLPPTPGRPPVRVLIVDDHPLVRRGLADMLGAEPGVSVCGEAGDVAGAWRELERARPGLLILDLSLPGGDGLDLIKRVRARHPLVRILAVSMHDEKTWAPRALRAGARGFVHKHEPPATVVQAMREVLAGRVYVSRDVEARLREDLARHRPRAGASPLEALSDRELEVLDLLGEGRTTAQIAEALHISRKTVQSHREHLKRKLHIENAVELVRYAVETKADRLP